MLYFTYFYIKKQNSTSNKHLFLIGYSLLRWGFFIYNYNIIFKQKNLFDNQTMLKLQRKKIIEKINTLFIILTTFASVVFVIHFLSIFISFGCQTILK